MIYIWISMLINQLSFFFFRIRDERMDSSIKGSHMTSPHYDSDRLRSLDYDSKILLNKNLPTITLWEKSHENVHCNFFFKGNVLHFILKEFHSIVSPKSISDQIKGTFMWKETFTMAFIISEKMIQFLLLSEIIWNAPIMWISGILSPRLCEPHNKVSTKWKP